jgi:hypothetical protein
MAWPASAQMWQCRDTHGDLWRSVWERWPRNTRNPATCNCCLFSRCLSMCVSSVPRHANVEAWFARHQCGQVLEVTLLMRHHRRKIQPVTSFRSQLQPRGFCLSPSLTISDPKMDSTWLNTIEAHLTILICKWWNNAERCWPRWMATATSCRSGQYTETPSASPNWQNSLRLA